MNEYAKKHLEKGKGNDEVRQLYAYLMRAKEVFDEDMSSLQEKCDHDWQKVIEEKDRGWFVDRILTHKYCKKCMKILEKPDGKRTEICLLCWGKMKQCEENGKKTKYFRCNGCGNTDKE